MEGREDLLVKTEGLDTFDLLNLMKNTHDAALQRNDETTRHWIRIRDEHSALLHNLQSIAIELSHQVMVPIGSKALVRGKMVHTNEILVCLGDGWFVKCSAKKSSEICERRIKMCDEMLDKLEKERNFLISQKQLPVEQEAFASEEQSEILEPYNEEREAEWRVRHRQKEQEYRQRLAELRNKEKTPVNNEEDLWKRLDQLELEEELQEELDRLHSEDGYYSNDEQDYGEEVEEDEENSDESRHQVEEVRKRNGFVQKDLGQSSMAGTSTDDSTGPEYEPKRRRVSFADLHQEENDGSSEEDEQRIVFHHTPIESTDLHSHGCEIPQSPADIYTQYRIRHSKDKETVPKSILKKSSEPIPVQQTASLEQVESLPTVSAAASKKVPRRVSPISVFGDVLEHSAGDLDIPQAPSLERPTSKFRANRQAAKQ